MYGTYAPPCIYIQNIYYERKNLHNSSKKHFVLFAIFYVMTWKIKDSSTDFISDNVGNKKDIILSEIK